MLWFFQPDNRNSWYRTVPDPFHIWSLANGKNILTGYAHLTTGQPRDIFQQAVFKS